MAAQQLARSQIREDVMKSHILKIDPAESEQGPNDQSYIGGKPTLPEDWEIPLCKLCGREQTFFFQVAFPEGYEWAGSSLAVFACTSCASEDYAIPELLDVLQEAVIPDGFLETYQTNFRFFVFGTLSARIRNDYIDHRTHFALGYLTCLTCNLTGTG